MSEEVLSAKKISTTRLNLYLFAMFLVSYESLVYLANDMIMPGMVEVTAQFNVGLEYVATSLSIYILGNTFLQLFLGPSADRFGKKRIILIGNCLFFIFTIVIALSTNIQEFMASRLLQGTGCAFVAIGYSVIHENFNDKNSVRLLALMGNVTILAPLLGPIVGGIIISYSGWRTIFVVIAIAALIIFIGLIKFTPIDKEKSLDRISFRKSTFEYISILNNKSFALGTIAISMALIPLLSWIGMTPVLIMESARRSFSEYIICQVIALGGLSIASILMQFIVGKFSYYKIMVTGAVLFFIGAFLNLFCYNYIYLLSINFFISSFGLGLFNGMGIRSIITTSRYSKNMTMSLFIFFETIAMAGGIEFVNVTCSKYNFSLFSFALIIFIISFVSTMFMLSFSFINRKKNWD